VAGRGGSGPPAGTAVSSPGLAPVFLHRYKLMHRIELRRE
jgi:hypothetical protein